MVTILVGVGCFFAGYYYDTVKDKVKAFLKDNFDIGT